MKNTKFDIDLKYGQDRKKLASMEQDKNKKEVKQKEIGGLRQVTLQ